MKIQNILITPLFLLFVSPCWGNAAYDKEKVIDAGEGLLKQGVPEIVKKSVSVLAIGAISAKAKAEYDAIEDRHNNSDIENMMTVTDNLYHEEKEKFKEIANDVETIYTYGVEPVSRTAANITFEKSKNIQRYYAEAVEPELEQLYEVAAPIAEKKFEDSSVYIADKWDTARPTVEKHYESLRSMTSEFLD